MLSHPFSCDAPLDSLMQGVPSPGVIQSNYCSRSFGPSPSQRRPPCVDHTLFQALQFSGRFGPWSTCPLRCCRNYNAWLQLPNNTRMPAHSLPRVFPATDENGFPSAPTHATGSRGSREPPQADPITTHDPSRR